VLEARTAARIASVARATSPEHALPDTAIRSCFYKLIEWPFSRSRRRQSCEQGKRSRYTVSEDFDVGIRLTPKEASRDGASWKTLQGP
jgi:hypothetical protein